MTETLSLLRCLTLRSRSVHHYIYICLTICCGQHLSAVILSPNSRNHKSYRVLPVLRLSCPTTLQLQPNTIFTSTIMSSTFSLHSNLSDEELPSYEEVSLPPNVTIEEREISSDDEDEDDYEQSETRKTIKQSTKTFASIKSFLSGSVAPPAEFTKSIITFDQTVVPSRPKADRKPSFKREYTLLGRIQFEFMLTILVSRSHPNINFAVTQKCHALKFANGQHRLRASSRAERSSSHFDVIMTDTNLVFSICRIGFHRSFSTFPFMFCFVVVS